jgi:type VI secretion system protein VasD
MNSIRSCMKPETLLNLVAIAVISVLLTACQSMNSTVGGYLNLDTDLQIDFNVDADINPDEFGKASPLFIRLYELKAVKMINKAGFIDIFERDKEVLGADMVAVYKLKRFKPGESRTEHFVLDGQTHYVALFAEFLKYRESKYKLIIPVTAKNVFQNSVVVRVSGDELVIDQKTNSESAEF